MRSSTTRKRLTRTGFTVVVHLTLLWALVLSAKSAPVPGLERLEHLPADHPLAAQWIRAIHQDRWGFLWLGSINGIHRFDGMTVKSFTHGPDDPSSLPNNYINSIYEDHQGFLWIATADGLARMQDEPLGVDASTAEFATPETAGRFRTFRHDPEDATSLSHSHIYGVVEDRRGDLWVATLAGADRFDRDLERFERFPIPSSDPASAAASAVTRSRAGDLWFGGRGPSLIRLDLDQESLQPHLLSATEAGPDRTWAIAEDRDGFLWCGTVAGDLYRFDPARTVSEKIALDLDNIGFITTVLPRPDGEIWIGTDHQGLVVYHPTTGNHQAYQPISGRPGTLSDLQVSSLFQDRSGTLWLGTNSGLDKYVPARDRFGLLRHRPGAPTSLISDSVIDGLEGRDGTIWIGTDAGLARLDRDGTVIRSYHHRPSEPEGLTSNNVRALLQDQAGDLWIATDRGLDLLTATTENFEHIRPSTTESEGWIDTIYSLAETEPGVLWIGGVGGLIRLDKKTRGLTHPIGPPNTLISILAAPSGDLWLANYGRGLIRFRPGVGELSSYQNDDRNPRSLSSNFLISFYQDASGILWIGTVGGGLNRFDPELEEFTSYRKRDGLANDNVQQIVEDDAGMLWLGTDRGLTRFDPKTGTMTNFTTEDGLQRSYFGGAGWRLSTGEIYFNGNSGLTVFRPHEIEPDPRAPEVVISDFLLLNHSIPFSARHAGTDANGDVAHLVLDHRDPIFAFEFAALHYAQPKKNRYAYRLEGFNSDWVQTDIRNRLATYTNLDAGDYVFRVKAANPDGVWNEKGATVRVTVRPPPWQSGWAYALYAAMLATLVATYLRSHRKELTRERQAAQRERAVSQRLREVDRLKDEFLANTSHELRTPLFGMTGLAESLIDGATGELPESTRANLSMIVASGQRLSHLVDDILDFSKLRHQSLQLHRAPVDLWSLAEVVLTLSQPLADGKELELINAVPDGLPAVDADEHRLQQILYNLVGNAIKFTESGSVTVAAEHAEDRLRVRVEDTGIGITKIAQVRIFDAFEQGEASAERRYGGTGLGLAITRQLVELHGGALRVESTPGRGSIFIFDLPLAEEPALHPPTQPPAEATDVLLPVAPPLDEPASVAMKSLKTTEDSAHILVVDDEPVNRQVLVNQLVAESYRVSEAANGPEALEKIEQSPPDLVLLDVMMPQMSGYEVCRTLRQSHPIDALPVVFLTAKSQPSDLVVGLAAGANDYLPKPISKSELLARVATHLDLLKVHHQLSELVDERTTQVRERERLLEERQRLIGELEARNAELARFNYTVSHDLQNPLTTIKNFVDLARHDAAAGANDRLEHDLDRLQTAAEQLHRLLEDLLEFSKIGLQPNLWVELSFGDLVRSALTSLEGAIAEAAARIEVPESPAIVRGDREQLELLMRLLLDNALHHAGDAGPPRIEINMRSSAEEQVFYIRDHGVGIDPRYHDKIFDLFQRLDPQASAGTGIGLSLAKRIVESHGGRIWVESEGLGKGSTFYFTLSAEQSAAP